jgi:phage/plasmid-associated DNA primase
MSKALGEYKGTVPITLITQKRNSIGSTSSEIVQLMGTRYAVMQEPSKGDTINEGIMKEITGGDPIQGRALFKDAVTFIPQFKLVVCTNVLFDIKSNDDGTWRRIRVCDFMSKFTDNPYTNDKFPKDNFPHQFQVDKESYLLEIYHLCMDYL